jgi:hypothetical protein
METSQVAEAAGRKLSGGLRMGAGQEKDESKVRVKRE